MNEPERPIDVPGCAAGCGLLVLLHFAGLGAVAMGAALLGAPEGDVGLVLFAAAMYALAFPFAQLLYGGLGAALLDAAGNRAAAVGLGLGSVLTVLLGGPLTVLLFVRWTANFHP